MSDVVMGVYRVVVAHQDKRVGEVYDLPEGHRGIPYRYFKKIEEVRSEPGDSVAAVSPGGDDAPKPRRGRKPKASEVTVDEPDRTESAPGVPDGEE